jgi:hypothetical protein
MKNFTFIHAHIYYFNIYQRNKEEETNSKMMMRRIDDNDSYEYLENERMRAIERTYNYHSHIYLQGIKFLLNY